MTALHPKMRRYVDSAVRKLGPERAFGALRSFENGNREDWDSCVIARAYGQPGELRVTYWEQFGAQRRDEGFHAAHQYLGLTARETHAVIKCFDGNWGKGGREYLKYALLREAAKVNAAPSGSTADTRSVEATP